MSHDATLPLTDADVARYQEDGAICIRQAFARDWIERLGAAIDADMKTPGPMVRINTPAGKPGLFFVDFQLWQRHDACRDFAFTSPAADIAARLMGSHEVVYYHDHLLVKEPDTEERTPWHHDQPYYPIDGQQIVSLWLPLDAVSRDVCVEYVRGSHRWGRWFAPKFFRQGGVDLQGPGRALRGRARHRRRARQAHVPVMGHGTRRRDCIPCADPARRTR